MIVRKLVIVCLLFCIGCGTTRYSSEQMQGTYYSQSDSSIRIIIRENTFTQLDLRKRGHLATPCCDTIVVGEFDFDRRGFVRISSPDWLSNMYIEMDVTESISTFKDSIIFHIYNPIDQSYKMNNSKGGELEYLFLVQPIGGSLSYFKENRIRFDKSRVSFYNPQMRGIHNFMIGIIPKESMFVKNIYIREVNTLEYEVKNKNSNEFVINIPRLTYGFFSYKRLKSAYAKIVNRNTIVWEGEVYERFKN